MKSDKTTRPTRPKEVENDVSARPLCLSSVLLHVTLTFDLLTSACQSGLVDHIKLMSNLDEDLIKIVGAVQDTLCCS